MTAPKRLGDFEIVGEIGRGGFGVVYRGRQVSLDRPVAVKVLFRHLLHTEEQVTRFEREARAAARLDHPGIVSVYAWGTDGEDFYIVQRLIGSGRTLADELRDVRAAGGPPKGWFRRVAELLAHVADGLQQAHERGIVHRDVKPSNILLDEAQQPCLGDFGLAKVEDGLELSRTGEFMGSPYYMSPEQADSRRGEVDVRSDVYAMGVTLYELLTLTQPFHGASAHEIVRSIVTEEPRRPSRIEERVPADLETICLHAMEKDPARRYQSAAGLAADLRAFLDGEPIAAVPIGTVRRMVRGVRRHREKLVAGVLGTVIVGVVAWAFSIQRASQSTLHQAAVQAQQATIHADIQARRSDDVQQIGEDYTRKIQDALQRNDTEEAEELVLDQQRATQSINENYRWFADQLQSLQGTEAFMQVGSGVATGGLLGGMQSLNQVLSTGESEAESPDLRQRLANELASRMSNAYELLKQGPAAAEGTPPDGSAAAAEAAGNAAAGAAGAAGNAAADAAGAAAGSSPASGAPAGSQDPGGASTGAPNGAVDGARSGSATAPDVPGAASEGPAVAPPRLSPSGGTPRLAPGGLSLPRASSSFRRTRP